METSPTLTITEKYILLNRYTCTSSSGEQSRAFLPLRSRVRILPGVLCGQHKVDNV